MFETWVPADVSEFVSPYSKDPSIQCYQDSYHMLHMDTVNNNYFPVPFFNVLFALMAGRLLK